MRILQLSSSALFLSLSCGAWDLSPAKLATVARFDLAASFPVSALNDGAVITGSGSISRQSWLPEKDWPLTYTVQVPIVRFAWNEFAVRFVPERSGTVHLSLRGPWEEVTPGREPIYRQEVLWDAFQTTGAPIANGGFDSVGAERSPVGAVAFSRRQRRRSRP